VEAGSPKKHLAEASIEGQEAHENLSRTQSSEATKNQLRQAFHEIKSPTTLNTESYFFFSQHRNLAHEADTAALCSPRRRAPPGACSPRSLLLSLLGVHCHELSRRRVPVPQVSGLHRQGSRVVSSRRDSIRQDSRRRSARTAWIPFTTARQEQGLSSTKRRSTAGPPLGVHSPPPGRSRGSIHPRSDSRRRAGAVQRTSPSTLARTEVRLKYLFD
jgi:hypothetical protein